MLVSSCVASGKTSSLSDLELTFDDFITAWSDGRDTGW